MSDVQDRARAAAIKRCLADCYDVPLEQTRLTEECTNAASSMLAALEAAGIALIDAASLRELEKQITDLLEQLEEWKLLARGF